MVEAPKGVEMRKGKAERLLILYLIFVFIYLFFQVMKGVNL